MEIAAAGAEDLPAITEHMRRMKLDTERLEADQFIVAREGGRIVAFGRVKPYDGVTYELAGVGVLEEARGSGLGARIVAELIARFPSDDVYITTDLPDYFARFGFARLDDPPAPLVEKLSRICGSLRSGVVAMALHRR